VKSTSGFLELFNNKPQALKREGAGMGKKEQTEWDLESVRGIKEWTQGWLGVGLG